MLHDSDAAVPLASPQPAVAGSIRALHVINGEHYAGAERVQDLLAGYLPAEGVAVAFACLKRGRFTEARQFREAELLETPMHGRLDLSVVRRVSRFVRSGGYQLLHSHTPRSLMVAAAAASLAGVPLVHHVHSPTSRDTTRSWLRRANATLERLLLGRAAALIAVSASLKRHLVERGLPESQIVVVPNGVPAQRAVPPRPAERGEWTLGMVALFRPRKGIEVLLEAMALLRAAGHAVRLRAIGDFESETYRQTVLALADQLGLREFIDWVGFTKEVEAELQRVDMLVLPSLFGEGMPMVVLEALAAGLPVVATRVEGVPEVIRDGTEGVLAEPGDAASFAAAIERVVTGRADWQAMSHAARARHAERYSAEVMSHAVAEVYRSVLGRKHRR